MKKFSVPLKLEQISAHIPGKIITRKKVILNNVSELKEANQNSICFFENSKYSEDFKSTSAGLVFVLPDLDQSLNTHSNLILVDKPYIYFMLLVKKWQELTWEKPDKMIADSARFAKSTVLGKGVIIGENVVIGEKTKIGKNTIINANVNIGNDVVIGDNCFIYPNATIYNDTIIRNRVILHSGCVIGSDGFGYLLHEGKQNKIPQVGNVIIHDDVEIGANTTIDRATIGSTVIGEDTKIDNLVQIGHNCIIGKHSIICAQVGLAGSTEIGDYVYLAGQVGVAGHLKIEDEVMVGAQSGVSKSIPAKSKYFGSPAIDARTRKRIIAVEKKLPDLLKTVNKLTKK